jgi:hypothetical protein
VKKNKKKNETFNIILPNYRLPATTNNNLIKVNYYLTINANYGMFNNKTIQVPVTIYDKKIDTIPFTQQYIQNQFNLPQTIQLNDVFTPQHAEPVTFQMNQQAFTTPSNSVCRS